MTSIKAIAASSAVPASAKGRDMPAERHYGDDTEFGPEATQGRLERHESEIALSARQGSATDSLTLLISKGPRLAKLWRADGAIESYQDAKYFSVEVKPVNSLRDVEIVLSKYEANPRCAVIRGIPASGVDLEHIRRLGELFPDQPHRWLALDVDEYDTGAERWFEDPVPHIEQFIRAALPPGFQDVSYIWALSGSAGHSKSPTKLKLRLWFWLDRAVDGATLKVWRDALDARPNAPKKAIDGAIFHPVQLTFIAAPVLEPGAECPIVQRRGFVEGALGDEALTTSFENLPTQQKRVRGRTEMRDPREIPGIVGAFNRLVTIEEAVEVHLAGEFEASPNDNSRYTWLRSSSGAPEGAFITSDGLRFCNTHGSAPESAVALNAWDLVRVYHFGDRDSVQESALPPTQRPSHKAMVDWAYKNIEGLREEMRAARPSAADEFNDLEDDPEEACAVAEQLRRDRQTCVEREETERIERKQRVETLRQRVTGAADVEALKQVCADVAADQLIDAVDREGLLLPAVEQRYTQITGSRLRRDLARRMVAPCRATSTNGANAPDWLSEWVYIAATDSFFNLKTKISDSRAAFDARNTGRMPLRQGSATLRDRASELAVHAWQIQVVDNVTYHPAQGGVFFDLGKTWANTYKPDSVPSEAAGGEAAVRMVVSHIERLFPDPRERGLLLSWIAHNVRYPGRKIRWAPYVWGGFGVGKTFLGRLLALAMGRENVRTLDGATLLAPHTGWLIGQAVTVIEEVKQPGNHRYDIEEKLKAAVANNEVDVHPKHVNPFTAPNVTNYLLLSNYPDGLPVREGDRRYFFLEAAVTREEAEVLSADGYFDSLHDAAQENAGAIRRWLIREVELHPEFDPNGRAPKTTSRDLAIQISRSDLDFVVEEALGDRQAVTTEWVCGKVEAAGLDRPRTSAISRLLVERGFRFKKQMRIGQKPSRVYVRESLSDASDQQLRAALAEGRCREFEDVAEGADS